MSVGPTYEQEKAFLLSLGEAIAMWQAVESATYQIFQEFFRDADHRLASLAFHHRQSFDSKIDLLDKCAYFMLSEIVYNEKWAGLFRRLKQQVAVRNRLVHSGYHTGFDGTKPTVSLGPSYMDAQYAIKNKYKNPELIIDEDKMRLVTYDFEELSRELHLFIAQIQCKPSSGTV